LTKEALDVSAGDLQQQTDAIELPEDFRQQVEQILEERPELPWDAAVARILNPPEESEDAASRPAPRSRITTRSSGREKTKMGRGGHPKRRFHPGGVTHEHPPIPLRGEALGRVAH